VLPVVWYDTTLDIIYYVNCATYHTRKDCGLLLGKVAASCWKLEA
jgi:hypothetical protein